MSREKGDQIHRSAHNCHSTLHSLTIAAAFATILFMNATSVFADGRLVLQAADCQDDANPGEPGFQVEVELRMLDLTGDVTGFQAFAEYDTGVLSYRGDLSSYTNDPFPLHIQGINQADDGRIELDGSDDLGDPGTSDDSLLATLVFDVDVECVSTTISFEVGGAFPSELSFQGLPVTTTLEDTSAFTLDDTDPVITCPADLTLECDEPVGPSVVLGETGPTTGGLSVYYNATGPQDLSNAAYIRAQVSLSNPNGAEFFFDTADLAGVPGVSWASIFSGLPAGQTQFGLDIIRPLETDDGSVVPPTLTAVDNTDSTPGGATPAGTVNWAINDYKPNSPSGPVTPSNQPTNSIIRGPAGGDPMVDIEIVQLDLVGTTLSFTGKLVSDGTLYWFTPATPDSPMSNFGLNGDFYIAGSLELDSSGAGVDHFQGQMTVVANAPSPTGLATATDNCTLFPEITFSDDDSGLTGCDGTGTILRTWTATDECGNTASCVQTITIEDTTPPVIVSCPDDVTVQCDESLDPDDLATTLHIPFDNDPTLSPTQAPGVWYTDRFAPFGFAREFFDGDDRLKHSIDASDCSPCRGGSFNSAFYDTQGRKYDLDPGTTRMLIDLYVPADWATTERRMAGFWGTAFDATDEISGFPIIEFTSTESTPRFRWFTQDTDQDDSNGLQPGWIDMGLPTGFVYDDWYTLEIELVGDTFVGTVGDLQVTDFFTFGTVKIGNVILQGHNNTAGVTYDIYWDNLLGLSTAQATDNCDPAPAITFSDVSTQDPDPANCGHYNYTITRTWTATDACGNATSCEQTITVEDTEAPVITCPPDATVECDEPADPSNAGEATAVDNCDANPAIAYSDNVDFSGCGGNTGTIVRTWTATDACGNVSMSCQQTITVVDTTPPVITCPADLTVECDDPVDPGSTGAATATDNCDSNPAITFDDVVVPGSCANEFTIERTWTATDACGNASTCLQTITVVDTMPPVITCPDDIAVNADAGFCSAVVSLSSATATDNCDPAPVVTAERDDLLPLGDPYPTGDTIVTWTATDACGNSSSCMQTVTVNPVNDVNVEVELVGVFNDALPLTRCIHFVADDCTVTADVELTFTDHDATPATPLRAAATIEIACGNWTFLCAKDEQHTLYDTSTLSVSGTQYVTDTLLSLEGGDTDNDSDVDINDVTWLIFTFGDPDAPGGCPWDGATRDADFSNNGVVGAEDYTFLTANWLTTTTCACTMPIFNPDPVDEIDPRLVMSVNALPPDVRRKVDLDRNGVVDYKDVESFEMLRGLPNTLSGKMREATKQARSARGERLGYEPGASSR